MRNPGGYIAVFSPDRRYDFITSDRKKFEGKEHDTFSCQHCNHVVVVKPYCDAADAGGLCKQCMGLICGPCVDAGECTPLLKRIEQMEDRGRFLRQMQEW